MNDMLEWEYFDLVSGGNSRVVIVPVSSTETTIIRPGKGPKPSVKGIVESQSPIISVSPPAPIEYADLPEQVFAELPTPVVFAGPPKPVLFIGPIKPAIAIMPKIPIIPNVQTVVEVPKHVAASSRSDSLVAPIIVAVVIMGWWIINVLQKKRKDCQPTIVVPDERVEEQEPATPHDSSILPVDGEMVVIIKSNNGCCDEDIPSQRAKPFRLRSFSDAADEGAYQRAQETFKPTGFTSTYGSLPGHNLSGMDLSNCIDEESNFMNRRSTVAERLVQVKCLVDSEE